MPNTLPPVQEEPSQCNKKPGANTQGDDWASASLILAMFSIIPKIGALIAVMAISWGIVALVKRTRWKAMAITGIALAPIGALVGLYIGAIPAREMARQTVCMNYLSKIRQGCMLYMDKNEKQGLPTIGDLIREKMISEQELRCPWVSKRSVGESSYFFLAPGNDASEETIIACDHKGNHPNYGRNIVTKQGGLMEVKDEAEFMELLKRPENAAFRQALEKSEADGSKRR